MNTMKFFNLNDEVEVTRRRLPHWAQSSVVCYITWRTHDSMPKAVLESWIHDRNQWLLANHGIDATKSGWKSLLYSYLVPRDSDDEEASRGA